MIGIIKINLNYFGIFSYLAYSEEKQSFNQEGNSFDISKHSIRKTYLYVYENKHFNLVSDR